MSHKKNISRRSGTGKKEKKELDRLRRILAKREAELDREYRKNARLKRQLAALKGAYGYTPHERDVRLLKDHRKTGEEGGELKEMLRLREVNARRFAGRTYLSYLIQTVKESTLGLILFRISRHLRRLRLFRTIAAIVSALVVALLLSAFFLTALPFLILFGLGTLSAVFLRARAANRRLLAALTPSKRVRIVIFPEHITFSDDTFAERSAKAMAEEKNTTVLVVTPYIWSTKGLGGKGMFFTARMEAPHLYLIRKNYFFILRRRVLDQLDADITVIY